LKVEESAAWREIDMGDWEGRTMAAIHDEAPELVTQLFNDPASFAYPNGESFAAFSVRVVAALDRLISTYESGEVALIAHGGVCRAIIGQVLGVPMSNWLRLAQEYGSLNVIDWYDRSPVVVALNCGGEGVTGRGGDGATRRRGDGVTRRRGDGATRRRGDAVTRRRGDGVTR
jgi:broad specificity phosphatase PhoE